MTPVEALNVYGTSAAAARAMGVPVTTFKGRLYKAQRASIPKIPEAHLPIEALLDQASQRYESLRRVDDAQKWPVIKITDRKPIGVLWFGDPHLGDNGCNIDLLRRHAEICATTPGLYGANIGDSTNNWLTHGKLARQWAEQDASIHTERRLAKWLMQESGVDWLVWLVGNHDAWGSGETILRQMNTTGVLMQNWEARFKLAFHTGETVKIHAAHNFKGFSDWNPMHGPLKASVKASDADLYIAGHLHTPGSMQIDMPGTDRFPLLLRVASYKRFDTYAKVNGFHDHERGAAVLTIFNPGAADHTGKITHYFDVELGARVLTMLRREHKDAGGSKARRRKDAPGPDTSRRHARPGAGAPSRRGKVRPPQLGKRDGVVSPRKRTPKAQQRIQRRAGSRR